MRLGRTRLDLSPGFLLAVALVYFFDWQGLFTLALLAALVHEAGHWLALCLFHARPNLLRLEATGAVMFFDGACLSYGREALAALAGPAAGALLALFAAPLGAGTLAGISAVLTLFNLLPASGLDGGRVLRCLLLQRLSRERGERIARAVSLVTSAALLLSGLVLTLTLRSGWALLLAGAALLIREFFE